jgi:hypothetical protein
MNFEFCVYDAPSLHAAEIDEKSMFFGSNVTEIDVFHAFFEVDILVGKTAFLRVKWLPRLKGASFYVRRQAKLAPFNTAAG